MIALVFFDIRISGQFNNLSSARSSEYETSNLFSLLHTLLSRDQICSLWSSSKPRVEVDPLVQVPGRQEVQKKQGHLGPTSSPRCKSASPLARL